MTRTTAVLLVALSACATPTSPRCDVLRVTLPQCVADSTGLICFHAPGAEPVPQLRAAQSVGYDCGLVQANAEHPYFNCSRCTTR